MCLLALYTDAGIVKLTTRSTSAIGPKPVAKSPGRSRGERINRDGQSSKKFVRPRQIRVGLFRVG
jgi:hypothetical protein